MSLAGKQRDKVLEEVVRELLKNGVPPAFARITEQFADRLPDRLGTPTFKFVQQPRRGNMKVDAQNEMFKQAADDLELVYEENIETTLGEFQ